MSIWIYCTWCGRSLLDPLECRNAGKSAAASDGASDTAEGDRVSSADAGAFGKGEKSNIEKLSYSVELNGIEPSTS